MSNVCDTRVTIIDTKENIKRLTAAFMFATRKPEFKDADERWLGNLLLYAGYSHEQVERTPSNDVCLRGSITGIYPSEDGTELYIDTGTAWCPALKAIRLFVEVVTKTAQIYFTGDEPMCDVYWSNDPDVLDKHPDWECTIDDFC